MRCLDLLKLQSAEVKLREINPKYNQPELVFPLEGLVMCGGDKIGYDEFLIKYTAGTLTPEEAQAFEIIYINMLNILSRIEKLSAYGKVNYNYYKVLIEQFGGSGLVSSKKQQNIQDRVNRFKKQQALENESGLEIK